MFPPCAATPLNSSSFPLLLDDARGSACIDRLHPGVLGLMPLTLSPRLCRPRGLQGGQSLRGSLFAAFSGRPDEQAGRSLLQLRRDCSAGIGQRGVAAVTGVVSLSVGITDLGLSAPERGLCLVV
jgi:hypothetical protein